MIKAQRVLLKIDPTGTFTVTVQATNEKGEVIIGHSGGVPLSAVGKEVDRVSSELDRNQSHVSLVFKNQEKKA